jgi:hypothetical protein
MLGKRKRKTEREL